MNVNTEFDQFDADALTDDISDETLEAAAGNARHLAITQQLAASTWTNIPLICTGTLKPVERA